MFDLLHEIAQTLRNNKLRTSLTGIAVAWGVFMLIILLGAARGVKNSFNEANEGMTTNVFAVWGGRTSMPYKGYEEGRRIQLKTTDADALQHRLPAIVSDVMPFASNDTAAIISPTEKVGGGFEAVYPFTQQTGGVKITLGRFINDRDISANRRVIVLNSTNATILFGSPENALGKTVKTMGLGWTVVGVFEHRWRRQSYVPYTTFKAITGFDEDVKQFDITVEGLTDEASANEAEQKIRDLLADRHEFDRADRNGVWTWNRFADHLRGQAASSILDWAVWIIGILTLLTGIVGVSNIMFVSVRERTHEIGIRRAIGAKPRSILTQVLTESVAITTLFGYIGVVLGMAVLQVINIFFGNMDGFKNPTVDLSIALEVTVALIIAGACAGLFPALKAIKVKPVEALRDE